MKATAAPDDTFTRAERKFLARLDSPVKIQAFLDGIPYSDEDIYRCPRRVMRDRKAHCFDGALFAAAALRRLGYPPLVIDMLADNDDDHLLALYKVDGHWGAVAKSNFVGLRLREPVYRTVRELVMSYFEQFYNVRREKTLRSYTVLLNLAVFDRLHWMRRDEPLDAIADCLDKRRRVFVVTPAMVGRLQPVDKRSFQAGLQGANPNGLYRPPRERG
ncbi:MAG TPA: hypothetical protein VFL17_02165 [Anaerolineae bacterium]|nr:hypothetical protein [Anaerolineae bacterium]